MDVKLQQALARGTTKASVENELLGDLEQSGEECHYTFCVIWCCRPCNSISILFDLMHLSVYCICIVS